MSHHRTPVRAAMFVRTPGFYGFVVDDGNLVVWCDPRVFEPGKSLDPKSSREKYTQNCRPRKAWQALACVYSKPRKFGVREHTTQEDASLGDKSWLVWESVDSILPAVAHDLATHLCGSEEKGALPLLICDFWPTHHARVYAVEVEPVTPASFSRRRLCSHAHEFFMVGIESSSST